MTGEGVLLSWGENQYGQRGQPISESKNAAIPHTITQFMLESSNNNNSSSSNNNQESSQVLLKSLVFPCKIKQLACGWWHSALVTGDSLLLVCLSGLCSPLKMNKSNSEQGHVFTWGYGKNYQLGHGDSTTLTCPTVISTSLFQQQHIHQIACGWQHTIAISGEQAPDVHMK